MFTRVYLSIRAASYSRCRMRPTTILNIASNRIDCMLYDQAGRIPKDESLSALQVLSIMDRLLQCLVRRSRCSYACHQDLWLIAGDCEQSLLLLTIPVCLPIYQSIDR